jgi:hypothetical protein
MKIAGTQSIGSPTLRRKEKTDAGQGSGFASALKSPDSKPAVSAGSQAEVLNGLLALQEVGGEPEEKRRAVHRGKSLLDQLEELRLGLLMGRFPRGKLDALLRMVQSRKDHTVDPQLREILGEIELRAAVEVAKIRMTDDANGPGNLSGQPA